jgi:organic hydroperoxide reductase OsmC/OhrA
MPRELEGTNERGTNPERLFAAAYTSSLSGDTETRAAREGIALPAEAEIDASVAVGRRRADSA